MSLFHLAVRNISGNAFRSSIVFLCVFFVSGFALAMTLIIQGAESSLTLANQRLGADILVVPFGSEADVESSLLMGKPTTAWMSRDTMEKIARIPGVEAVSPQLYLGTMVDAPCCSASAMFMIAFDPETDFTVTPWLEQHLGRKLKPGEAIGGMFVFTPEGDDGIQVYGSTVNLVGNLEPTGTGLDQTMFFSFETAYNIARGSSSKAQAEMAIPDNSISSVLVRVRPGTAAQTVSMKILQQVPNITAIDSPDLFLSYRRQINGLVGIVSVALTVALILSIVVIDLVFSMAVHERRREIAVLRALGATRRSVFLSLLTEAIVLALSGGLVGLLVAALGVYLFRNLLVSSLAIPFLLPPLPSLLLEIAGGMVVVLASVSLSALLPAFKVSRQEPASAMRE